MKKLISLMLVLCLVTGLLPALGEETPAETAGTPETAGTADAAKTETEWGPRENEPAEGVDFDFILRLHPEALSGEMAKQAEGYAALLSALRFRGSFVRSKINDVFNLELSIIPTDSRAGAISVRIHGAQDLMFVESSLLGEKSVALSNSSLLNFCSKMSEHLGVPLQYIAMLLPYTWVYYLGLPIQDWNGMVESMDENGVISKEAVHYLWECWAYRLKHDEPLRIFTDTLTKDSDAEEAFRGILAEIPDYFEKTVAQEQEIRVLREGDKVIWRAASGDFFTETNTDTRWALDLNLPEMQCGYQPVMNLETIRENNRQSGRVRIQMLNTSGMQEDLVRLEASYTSFPLTWPDNAQSLFGVSLTGALLPNIGFSVYVASEENGHVKAEVRKPTVNMEPGAVMLTAEGDVTVKGGDTTIEEFSLRDLEGALDVLVANDSTIRAFLPDIAMPMIEGILHFLVGVPTSACQTIMNDLEKLGIVNLLMGE